MTRFLDAELGDLEDLGEDGENIIKIVLKEVRIKV